MIVNFRSVSLSLFDAFLLRPFPPGSFNVSNINDNEMEVDSGFSYASRLRDNSYPCGFPTNLPLT